MLIYLLLFIWYITFTFKNYLSIKCSAVPGLGKKKLFRKELRTSLGSNLHRFIFLQIEMKLKDKPFDYFSIAIKNLIIF